MVLSFLGRCNHSGVGDGLVETGHAGNSCLQDAVAITQVGVTVAESMSTFSPMRIRDQDYFFLKLIWLHTTLAFCLKYVRVKRQAKRSGAVRMLQNCVHRMCC